MRGCSARISHRARVAGGIGIMKFSWFSVFRALAAFILFGITFSPDTSRAQRPLGTDVSGYQAADLPWATAKAAGVRFAWTKATEGTGYVHPNFIGQVTGATNAGVYIGLYHYARPGLHPNITGA